MGVTHETCRAKKLSDIKYLRFLHQVGVFIYWYMRYLTLIVFGLLTIVNFGVRERSFNSICIWVWVQFWILIGILHSKRKYLPTDIAFIVQCKFAKLRDIEHYMTLTIMYDWHIRPSFEVFHRLIFKKKQDVSEAGSASFVRQRRT